MDARTAQLPVAILSCNPIRSAIQRLRAEGIDEYWMLNDTPPRVLAARMKSWLHTHPRSR